MTGGANTRGDGPASDAAAIGFRRSGNALPWASNFVRVIKALSPRKPAAALRIWTGLSPKQCENIVAERTGTSVDVLRACLATEHGWEFLQALMGDAPPLWFRELRYQYESARLQAEIAAAREKMRTLKRKR